MSDAMTFLAVDIRHAWIVSVTVQVPVVLV